jgi:hypothetical protein
MREISSEVRVGIPTFCGAVKGYKLSLRSGRYEDVQGNCGNAQSVLNLKTRYRCVRFEVFTAIAMQNDVFWDVNAVWLFVSSSETSVLTKVIRRNIPEDFILHRYRWTDN